MKRYRTKPKNYAWAGLCEAGVLDDQTTILRFDLVNPSDVGQGTGLRKTVNLQRIIGDLHIQINNGGLGGHNEGIWAPCGYLLVIRDTDDSTFSNPFLTQDLRDETILAHGITDLIGYGTVLEPLVLGSGNVVSQSSAFNAWSRTRIDIRTNRKITSDEQLSLFVSKADDVSSIDFVSNEGSDFNCMVSFRTLIKIP